MKKFLSQILKPALAITAFFLLIYSCAEHGLVSDQPVSDDGANTVATEDAPGAPSGAFSKSVGARIDKEKGERWIANHTRLNGSSNQLFISSEAIKEILAQPGCAGVSLYYAVDAENTLHIIPIGKTDAGVSLVPDVMITSDTTVTWNAAAKMISAYSGEVRSHFFGANTFDRLFQNENCSAIRITLAVNDEGKPQLLLSDAGDVSPDGYEDVSNPCPPYCGTKD